MWVCGSEFLLCVVEFGVGLWVCGSECVGQFGVCFGSECVPCLGQFGVGLRE